MLTEDIVKKLSGFGSPGYRDLQPLSSLHLQWNRKAASSEVHIGKLVPQRLLKRMTLTPEVSEGWRL